MKLISLGSEKVNPQRSAFHFAVHIEPDTPDSSILVLKISVQCLGRPVSNMATVFFIRICIIYGIFGIGSSVHGHDRIQSMSVAIACR